MKKEDDSFEKDSKELLKKIFPRQKNNLPVLIKRERLFQILHFLYIKDFFFIPHSCNEKEGLMFCAHEFQKMIGDQITIKEIMISLQDNLIIKEITK